MKKKLRLFFFSKLNILLMISFLLLMISEIFLLQGVYLNGIYKVSFLQILANFVMMSVDVAAMILNYLRKKQIQEEQETLKKLAAIYPIISTMNHVQEEQKALKNGG